MKILVFDGKEVVVSDEFYAEYMRMGYATEYSDRKFWKRCISLNSFINNSTDTTFEEVLHDTNTIDEDEIVTELVFRALLNLLSDEEREIAIKLWMEDKALRDVAEELSIVKSTLYYRRLLIRKKIKKYLKNFNGFLEN